jgi:acetyl-CoA carboxylase biotin carboxyl carrier protein
VLSESDGKVTQLAVNEGDVVQEGDLIAVIED